MHLDGIHLQERDISLLRGLFESRVMTSTHIAQLYFENRPEAAKKRLQKLKAVGLVKERPRKIYERSVLFLTRRAFDLLSEARYLSDYPRLPPTTFQRRVQVSDLTIHHELAVMDVKAALHSAVRLSERYRLAEFSTWPFLYQFKVRPPAIFRSTSREILVKPDSFIRISDMSSNQRASEHDFFLEVDRSTEVLKALLLKATCYAAYYKSGGLAAKKNQHRSTFKRFPFRVLMLFNSEERLDNVAATLLNSNPPILRQVWLATISEFLANPLGEVWLQPIDFRSRDTNPFRVKHRLLET